MRIVRICVYTFGVNPIPPPAPPMTPTDASPIPLQAQPVAARVPFTQLSAGRREVFIEHAGQVYRLSLTAQNKLILTK